MTQQSFIAQGKRVLEVEAQALREIEQYINADFEHACQLMFHCTGRIIVIGMGKSGHIGNKIAATLQVQAPLHFLFTQVKRVMVI